MQPLGGIGNAAQDEEVAGSAGSQAASPERTQPRPCIPGLGAPRLGARPGGRRALTPVLRLSPCSAGNTAAACGSHSPDQELQEDHVTAATCENQAHRKDRAHGQCKGRGASVQRKRRLYRYPRKQDRCLGHRMEHRHRPGALLFSGAAVVSGRGAVVRSRPRPHSSEGAS